MKKFRFTKTNRGEKPSRVLAHAEERAKLDSIPARVARLRAEGDQIAASILERRSLKGSILANERTIRKRIKFGSSMGDLVEVTESMRRRLALLESIKKQTPSEGQK